MANAKIALIGGSGIGDNPQFTGVDWHSIETGYSNGYGTGTVEYLENSGIIFIPRHGRSTIYGPSRTQYAANLIAAKILGANVVIATSAVGSLKPYINVESLVVPHDYIDETERDDNLFGVGLVIHGSSKPPFSEDLRRIVYECATQNSQIFDSIHERGVYVVIPGDRFGTPAEGTKRSQYGDVVGMTICPEASMAVQLGLHYAVVAFPVDRDLDASHESGTLAVMGRLSQPERVPYYISQLIERARGFAPRAGLLPQLKGNIIVNTTGHIKNVYLRQIADELIRDYCVSK